MSAETRDRSHSSIDSDNQDWRTLAEAASKEQDPARMLEIVSKLNRALDEQIRPQFQSRSAFAND